MRNVEVGGTSDFCKAEIAPLPYRFVKKIAVNIQFSSCVRGATSGIMPLVAYTQNPQRTPTL